MDRIQRLLEVQSPLVHFTDDGLSPEYMVVLNHLWNQRYEAAADHASTIIAAENDHPATIRLYRAWIESLSEIGDHDCLDLLSRHLLNLGRVEPELQQTYLALRGLIHIYLDQAPMARVILRSIQGRDHNPYCLEFEELCARRNFDEARPFAVAASKVAVNDWFHWNTLVADLANTPSTVQGDTTVSGDLQDILTFTLKSFPGSPINDLVSMHRAMDHGYWAGAQASATRLNADFPDHNDYGFFAAFCSFQIGDYANALKTLRALGDFKNQSDADVLHLTGEILAYQATDQDNEDMAAQAIDKLDRAARIYRRCGKPIDSAVSLIQRLERTVLTSSLTTGRSTGDVSGLRVPRNWMCMLTPEQYSILAESGDQDIGTLHRPMGREAMPGDVVLFMSKSAHVAKQPPAAASEWRIVAVYRVATRPYWHPTHRWHNGLELIDRPDSPIPIDAKEVASDWNIRGQRYSLPRGHHARFGVYELDESAMDLVISAVKRRTDGIVHDVDRRNQGLVKKDSV